jgi:hypothetical protein
MEQGTQLLAPLRTTRATHSATRAADRAIADESAGIRNMPRPAVTPRRFLVRPLVDPETTLDLTDAVADAIARELGRAFGGNPVLNRLEADAHLASLLAAATRPSPDADAPMAASVALRPQQTVELGLPLHVNGGQHAG